MKYLHKQKTDLHFRRKGKKLVQRCKSAMSRAGSLPNHKEEALRALASAAPSDLCSGLALSLSTEAFRDEEAESRDMAEAERQLDSSPLEELSEQHVGALGVAVLSSAATFCCGGQDVGSKVKMELLHTDETEQSVKRQTAGGKIKYAQSLFI